jgi:succinate dehydrogenase / fumarate reductase, cytochrome b subunit
LSTAAAAPLANSAPRHFLLRRLHSLTGLLFGGYLVVHLLINATLIQGGRVFQEQVDKIHSLPFLPVVETVFIFLPIIFHTIYGVWMILGAQPNVGRYPYKRNIFYFLQRSSAVVIVLFMLFHVLGMKGALGSRLAFEANGFARESSIYHFQAHWTILWIIYPLGVLASCYHLANGFWTAAITWGLTVSAQSQRRWGYVCAGLFVFTLTCGLLALAAMMGHTPLDSTPWIEGKP